jgi:hypothetical protein
VDEDEVGFCHCAVVDYWMLWCGKELLEDEFACESD